MHLGVVEGPITLRIICRPLSRATFTARMSVSPDEQSRRACHSRRALHLTRGADLQAASQDPSLEHMHGLVQKCSHRAVVTCPKVHARLRRVDVPRRSLIDYSRRKRRRANLLPWTFGKWIEFPKVSIGFVVRRARGCMGSSRPHIVRVVDRSATSGPQRQHA